MNLTNCKVSISRNSNDVMSIELTDRDSGTRFFRGVMSFEDFARAITGQCEMAMTEADVRGLDRLGLIQETKEVMISIPKGHATYLSEDFAKAHAAWAKPYEVDGWVADIDQRFNGHRGGGTSYKTVFRRWVAKKEES